MEPPDEKVVQGMDGGSEVVVTPPRVTVREVWNALSCYGLDRPVTISDDGIVIDHRDLIPVPHEPKEI